MSEVYKTVNLQSKILALHKYLNDKTETETKLGFPRQNKSENKYVTILNNEVGFYLKYPHLL